MFLRICLCAVLWLCSTWAAAFTACVSTSAQLQAALQGATDAADDDIRVQSGQYQLPDLFFSIRGDFRFSGSWNAGCTIFSLGSVSTIGGPADGAFRLSFNYGGGRLQRFHFRDWRLVDLSERVEGSGLPGEIRFQRNRVSDTVVGLQLSTRTLRVQIDNTVIDGHQQRGLFITRGSSNEPAPELVVQHLSVLRPAQSSAQGMLFNSGAGFGVVRLFNNVLHGHSTDLALVGQAVELRHNFYNTLDLGPGATLTPNSGNNLSGDPGFATFPSFAPQVPNSALINAGESQPGLQTTRDYPGDPRLVGTRPDIGAVETSVNDSSELVVTSTADSGAGSLREAILAAETNPALKTIRFNIAGACPRLINLASPLPEIHRPVLIDGYTQPGSSPNDDPVIFNGTLCVVLSGAGTQPTALTLDGDNSDVLMTVKGLIFYGFTSEAINIRGAGRAAISGNLFGTGSNLILDFADTVIRVRDAPGTVIGGGEEADRNVIGRGLVNGVLLGTGGGSRRVINNLIGLGRNGISALPNGVGVRVAGGNIDDINGNWISDNTSHGIQITASPTAFATAILNNQIGRRVSGPITAGGNGGDAVQINSGQFHTVASNALHNSGGDGIDIRAASRRVLITRNDFQRNAGMAIDLFPTGVNPIDLDVGQTGANDQQNTVEILSARGSASQGEVRMRLSSANGNYRVELYYSEQPLNGAGFVNGGAHLVSSDVYTLSCATAVSNCVLPVVLPIERRGTGLQSLLGLHLTALVRDEEGNSSELSAPELVVVGDNLFKDGYE